MIKHLKSNKLISILTLIMCIIIIINPIVYAKSCLNAISVWAINILPLLFPFFVFTRLIVSLSTPKAGIMDKAFSKLYNCPKGSFNIFFLSALSGYPMGAKLICTQFENGYISKKDATKMLSFCSISGPMFMLGSVGLMMLKNYTAGIIILIANIIACLINGLIYRGKNIDTKTNVEYVTKRNSNILTDCVYDSLISILMVGAYIVLSFLIIEILKSIKFFHILTNAICCVFKCRSHYDIVSSSLYGLFEITNGILTLSKTSASIILKTTISSSLIGFGGISVMLQNLGFLSKLKISVKQIFLQKITQAILCFIITLLLSLVFF